MNLNFPSNVVLMHNIIIIGSSKAYKTKPSLKSTSEILQSCPLWNCSIAELNIYALANNKK